MQFVHNVLGTPYLVKIGDEVEIDKDYVGMCKIYAKEILVNTKAENYTEEELRVKVGEIVAHEIFHAYLNEAGLQLEEETEELLADFYMKNWRKMSNSIFKVLDEANFLVE